VYEENLANAGLHSAPRGLFKYKYYQIEKMKTLIKPYLRPFLIGGLTYGLLTALWDYIDKEKIDFVKQIFMTIAFGALMSWSTVAAQKRKQK